MSTCFLLFGLLAALATQLLFNAQTFNVLLKKQRVPFDNAGEAELPLQHVGDVESVETLELMGEDDAAASASEKRAAFEAMSHLTGCRGEHVARLFTVMPQLEEIERLETQSSSAAAGALSALLSRTAVNMFNVV